MKKIIIGMIFLYAANTNAQQYDQSAGVRLGHTSGITYKNFVTEEKSFELTLSGRNEGFQFIAMYVNHLQMEIAFSENFYAYYGLGGHAGFEKFSRLRKTLTSFDPPEFVYEDQAYFIMGIDATLGVEYRWLSVPVTLGFDIKPYFNYIGMRYTEARFWDAGISFKYIF